MDAKEFKEIRMKLRLDRNEMAELLELSNYTAVSNIELEHRNTSKLAAKFLRYLDSMKIERAKKIIKEINQFKHK